MKHHTVQKSLCGAFLGGLVLCVVAARKKEAVACRTADDAPQNISEQSSDSSKDQHTRARASIGVTKLLLKRDDNNIISQRQGGRLNKL